MGDFSEAMGDAHVVDHPDEGAEDRDASKDVKRASLLEAQGKLDVVSMLLHRRQFHADRVHDRIDAIQLFSDSSPNSGSEFQGMVADVHRKDKSFERLVLPGSTLAYYSLCDAISKTIALVWAVWLVVGPDIDDMRYWFDKVVGVTTDFGIEVLTVTVPNILRAFVAWASGTPLMECMALVDHTERLLRNAIRISGWGHLLGNIMKTSRGVHRAVDGLA